MQGHPFDAQPVMLWFDVIQSSLTMSQGTSKARQLYNYMYFETHFLNSMVF